MQLTAQQLSDVVAGVRDESTQGDAGAERRRFARLAVFGKIEIVTSPQSTLPRRYSALMRDISYGGTGLLQAVPCTPGEQFVLRLPCGEKGVLLMLASARFCRPLAHGLFGVGAEFDCQVDTDFLDNLVSANNHELQRIRQSILN